MNRSENLRWDRSYSAGSSKGISSGDREKLELIKTRYEFDKKFELVNHLESSLLSFDARKPIPNGLTVNQQNERYKEVIKLAEKLKEQLDIMGDDEISLIQRYKHKANEKNINDMLAIDPNTDTSRLRGNVSYYDSVNHIKDNVLPYLIHSNEQGLSSIQECKPTTQESQKGRKSSINLKELIQNLTEIYVKGTGKGITYTHQAEYHPDEPFTGKTVRFCIEVLNIIMPKNNILNVTIGNTIKDYKKSIN